jgi:5-methylcytosine-specific restriction endonuclease McrA
MDEALTRLVWERAEGRCEYCRLRQANSRLVFEIDHVIAHKHGGASIGSNLALSCFYWNEQA